MKKKIFKILRFLLFLSIGVLLLFAAFRGIDTDKLRSSFLSAHYGWIMISLMFGFFSLLSRAYRWLLLIEPLNYKPSFMNSLYSLMTGYLANYAFPRLGEVTRCGSLARVEKIPLDKLFGTVIVERIIDLLMLFILLVILVVGRFEFFGTFIRDIIFNPLLEKLNNSVGGSLILWLIILGIPASILIIYFLFRKKLSQLTIIIKIKLFIRGVLSGIKSIYTMKRRWEFILHSILIWVLYWLMTWTAVFAIPATSSLQLIDGLFLLVIGSFGFIVPVQGGIGAYHWIVSLGLTIYGIEKVDGLTYATLTHGSQAIMLISLGLISLLILFAVNRKKSGPEIQ